jgi:hypothetical protein
MMEDRGIRWAVDQALTREWLAEGGRGEPVLRTEMPVLRVINEFMDEKVAKALKDDPLKAFRAMADLCAVLSALVKVGYPYQSMLDVADDTLTHVAKMMKASLLRDYLDAPEERAAELHEMLLDLAAGGYWDSLRDDLDDELWRREMGQRERAC